MNKLSIKSLVPSASLITSFLLAAVASYLIVAHFQHTILQAWVLNGPQSSQVNTSGDDLSGTPAYASQQEVAPDGICGCPFCCG